jgi:adenylate cyclase class IV
MKGTYLFRVQVLIHLLNTPNTYVRVRDEGYRTTMTYKLQDRNEKYPQEEIVIDDFDNGVTLLLGLGCKKKYYYEKIREIWVATGS